MTSSKSKLRKFIDGLLALLALAKWIPFLGKWRELILTLSAVLAMISGMLAKCDNPVNQPDQQPKSQLPKTPEPTESPTPIHIPTASPTPAPTIVVDRVPEAGWPFTVRYTAKFEYNIYLWADKYKLQVMGQEYKTGHLIASAVVLRNPGSRRLTVRNLAGEILAEKTIEVK